ncbi:MAG TPA: 2OG-Fe(II) oxygenase family protein [Candidatus Nanoarchaeia archaeon]|nr:2OG-Fe(II) oxygenase family protein [Candidatus Nanoarchaeia archaeon]
MELLSKTIRITHDKHPFPHWILYPAFNELSIKKAAAALDSLKFTRSVSDLFQFWQTSDFKTLKLPQPLHELYQHFLSKKFLSYIAKLTNTKLSSTIDMSAFRYEDTDYLLPHDDQLEGRKIAYVLNLSTLKEKEGGALELFENNKSNPTKVVKRYQPVFNSLVLFQVSPTSWHQVAEVIKKNRLTITGWFHD